MTDNADLTQPGDELSPWATKWSDRRINAPKFQEDLRISELSQLQKEHDKNWGPGDGWYPESPSSKSQELARVFQALDLSGDWTFSVTNNENHLLLHSTDRLVSITVQVARAAFENKLWIRVYKGPLEPKNFQVTDTVAVAMSNEDEAVSVLNALLKLL